MSITVFFLARILLGFYSVGDLSPFEFFRQETSNSDVVIRDTAMRKLAVVAALMGPEKARSDMLPYLQSK